jgi:5-methylcytosine-specific restriction endonuclease McrA
MTRSKPQKIPASGHLTGRATKEWLGKNADSKPPKHVSDRIWLRHEGKCHKSGRKIRPGDKWHMDHIIALKDGGENRESNIAPILDSEHRKKTSAENTARAKEARTRRKHTGIDVPKGTIKSRGFVSRLKEPDKIGRIASGHEKHLAKMREKIGL